MVGHNKPRPERRHVLKSAHPYPEPVAVQRAGSGHQYGPVELRVEAKLRVDLDIAGQPPEQDSSSIAKPDSLAFTECVQLAVLSSARLQGAIRRRLPSSLLPSLLSPGATAPLQL